MLRKEVAGDRDAKLKAVRDQLTKKKKMLEDLADEVAGATAKKKKQDKETARRKKKQVEQGAHGEHTVVHAADMGVKCPDPSLHGAYEMAWCASMCLLACLVVSQWHSAGARLCGAVLIGIVGVPLSVTQ